MERKLLTPDLKTNMASPMIGTLLREGRLRQRLSISECAKRTHISTRYLEALEEEHWVDLPSESHRIGFLRLYSRFLGVSTEEVLTLYRQSKEVLPSPREASKNTGPLGGSPKTESLGRIISWQQLTLGGILLLVCAWGIYHAIGRRLERGDSRMVGWSRVQPHHARLGVGRRDAILQRIRVKAEADSWLRVVDDRRLLFEGILPGGASKEWSGAGPFTLKIGNIQAVRVFWNDQAVDTTTGAQGQLNEIILPPRSAASSGR